MASLPNHRQWRALLLAGLLAGSLLGSQAAQATRLPAGVVNYVNAKDAKAKIRFDGLVIFSNGESYLPVIPQDPALAKKEADKVLSIDPPLADYPDIIQFDNQFFLLRLIKMPDGHLTLPNRADYPIQLKEGLLPEDLVLPGKLLIPTPLKILLGEIPYNPGNDAAATTPPANATATTVEGDTLQLNTLPTFAGQVTPQTENAFVGSSVEQVLLYGLGEQALTSVNPQTGDTLGKIDLGCVPSEIRIHPGKPLAYAACLTTNELVVIDLTANLVRTRIPVGNNPAHISVGEKENVLYVSNRFSNELSLIDLNTYLAKPALALPGPGGVMYRYSQGVMIVADAFNDRIYLVKLTETGGQSVRELKGLASTVGMTTYHNEVTSRPELWLASRSENKARGIDMMSGEVIDTVDLGQKPDGMVRLGEKVYILSAGESRIDVLDMPRRAVINTIGLASGSFPADIYQASETDPVAFVSAAKEPRLFVVDLKTETLTRSVTLPFRSTVVAYAGTVDPNAPKEAEAAPAEVPAAPTPPLDIKQIGRQNPFKRLFGFGKKTNNTNALSPTTAGSNPLAVPGQSLSPAP